MVTRSGPKGRALSFVVAFVCLCWAAAAFAQSATGTITGTVVDGTGAALPGATVNVTEAGTGSVRTVVTDDGGRFRFAALNPGRYSLAVELASFSTLNVADIALLSTEVRDLGKLGLQIGGVTETVTIPRKSRPSRWRTARTVHAHPGRHRRDPDARDGTFRHAERPARRAGHEPESRLHPVAFRDSVTINGMPSQNKDVRVDGINIVDEGGCGTAYVNLNMDAVGEVQVIANGYTAENGRNNGGVISMVTKSGTNQLRASGWYNGRRDKFNENDYFRKATNQAKPLYRVNISGYSVGGPVVIPGLIDSRKPGGRRSTSSARRNSPTTRGRPRRRARTCPPSWGTTGISRRRGSRTARFSRSSTR